MKHEFHNPDNLTPEQVGEGYRLLLKSEFGRQEEQHQEIETWLQPRKDWHKSKIRYFGNFKFCTYRVPLSTWPLPEEGHHRELKEKPQITGQTGPADMPNKCGPSAADFEPAPLDNDRWESLLHKNSTLEKRVKELEKEVGGIDECRTRAIKLIKEHEELQSKITAAKARLAQLEWRPVSVMPTKEDADPFGNVQVCGITDGILQSHGLHSINYPFKDKNTHWRPAALPTIPDPSREEFEKWWAEHSGDFGADKVEAQKIWKAARRTE